MSVQKNKVKAVFDQVVELSSSPERNALLDRECTDDSELRGKVERLLAAYEQAEDFLESPPDGVLATIAPTIDQPVTEKPGTIIGPYKLLQKLGEGGMGVVYMAEQSEPVERRVALKVIKPGMDTGQVIARFEAERQAVAMMDHPGIAKVFDAGATESGRPYFVMELVKGIPLTQYCDEEHFTPKQRLALFVQVCQAVQHAHQKGIIHRDIKPTNVLVAEYDQQPVPKIIDFGVAKATSHKLTQKTMFTEFGQLVGTLEYMSPEQARLNQLDIDTRSDVYSLGVLLYELLTGETPFDRKRLQSAAFEEMLRIIREEEPPKPSTRLSGSNDRLAIAKRRKQTPDRLGKLVKGDLDWIVMKALEKDRARRYETANGFAADIERFLQDEAVLARPPSRVYRARKFVRRNKGPVAAALALFLALVAGICGTTVALELAHQQNVRANRNAQDAVQQSERAKQEAERATTSEQLAEQRAVTIQHNLYYAQMNLAGQAAQEVSGIGRVRDFLASWRPSESQRDLRGWEWYHLDSLCHRDLFTLSAHNGSVRSVSWSRDGMWLASASDDRTVKIWNAVTRRLVHTLKAHNEPVYSVSWSPNGKRLASASEDRTVRIWDAVTGEPIHTLRRHKEPVYAVAWSPDGTRLVSADGTQPWTSRGGAAGEMTVIVWDAVTGKQESNLKGHTASIHSICWSPDSERVASASGGWLPGEKDQVVRVWDVTTGKNTLTFSQHNGRVLSVSWSPDGKQLASAGKTGAIKLWDAVTGEQLIELGTHSTVKSISWSPDGTQLASAAGDRTIKIWQVGAGNEPLILRGHMGEVMSVSWSHDGNRLVSGSTDGTVKVWDVATGTEPLEFGGHTADLWDICWSPDSKQLASASEVEKNVRIWDAATRENTLTLEGHSSGVTSVCWSQSHDRLASGSKDGTIKIWNAATGKETVELDGHTAGIWELCWSPTDERLASASRDNTVRVWDVVRREEVLTLGHTDAVISLSWSPDGRRLAAASFHGTVKIWDAFTGEELLSVPSQEGFLMTVRWSPDNGRLALAGLSGKVRIWDASTAVELDLLAHTGQTTK